jgi:hypothetical protein
MNPYNKAFSELDSAFGTAFGQDAKRIPNAEIEERWEIHQKDPAARAAFIARIGERQGIQGPEGLQALDNEYQLDMKERFNAKI